MTDIIEFILNIIYPPRCILCQEIIPIKNNYICKKCSYEDYLIKGNRCEKCSRQIVNTSKKLCKDCENQNHSYEKGFALFEYKGKIKGALYRLKYAREKEVGKALGNLIVKYYKNEIKNSKIDLIIPVPIHPSKIRKRGYNQAQVIAKQISKDFKIPLRNDILIRIRNTRPQSKLSKKQRANNLVGAFSLNKPIDKSVKNILIIDDIYTTGSTIENCSKILKQNADIKIYFVTATIVIDNKEKEGKEDGCTFMSKM